MREFGFGADESVGREFEDFGPRCRHFRRRRCAFDERHTETRFCLLEGLVRAHHHARDHAQWRERVLCDPLGEAQGDSRQWRRIKARRDRFQFFGVERLGLALGFVPDDTDARLRPKRHEHELARGDFKAWRDEVIIGLV